MPYPNLKRQTAISFAAAIAFSLVAVGAVLAAGKAPDGVGSASHGYGYGYGYGHQKQAVCHKPGTPAEHTLFLPPPAIQAHIDHGDTLGPCLGTTADQGQGRGRGHGAGAAAGVEHDDKASNENHRGGNEHQTEVTTVTDGEDGEPRNNGVRRGQAAGGPAANQQNITLPPSITEIAGHADQPTDGGATNGANSNNGNHHGQASRQAAVQGTEGPQTDELEQPGRGRGGNRPPKPPKD